MATETLRPNAAGDQTDVDTASPAVAHYLNVDEVTPDDDTTHIRSLFVGRGPGEPPPVPTAP